ncbi:SusC/RagA family TonB-linked outer membrane protein [Echinicola pacifica]|uniref:SusC/RagA family TonB-linked outer membrane protein n=1 Tax=Echinicola pacifica TaxID=346377 RepID=A0A918PN55_9BACT|nr:TonB-dependent receptor [Echinicola pacifica]GGZ16914.1 SusC/RagA family TonB-linked outer membrane protein [Echinicola pacifica]
MKKFFTTTMFFMLVGLGLSVAQSKTVSGKIIDDTGETLPGVNIIEKGTSNGTTTDLEGNFSLSVSEGAIIVFSYIGYDPVERTVGNASVMDITLTADFSQLSEVIVVGYGTVKKSDLTGSVSTIDTKETFKAPTANLGNSLQGRASGVQVTSTNGTPGAGASIRIRGGNSITAGNEPLYVIDGFVGAGNISSINPNDIESMQVLKDASSTAIYGARGANGVILITTKQGRAGTMEVNLSSSYGIQQLPRKVDVLSGREFAEWINGQDTNPSDGLPFDLDNLPGEETDWQDVMISPAPITDNQISISGGTEKTKYFVSAGFFGQDGIIESTSFKRYSLRSNIDSKLSKVFSTGLNLSLSSTYSDNNNVDLTFLIRADPLMPVYNDDGTYNGQVYGVANQQSNILADNVLNENDTFQKRALINTYIQAVLFEKLTIKSTFGGDFLFSKQHQFIPSINPTSIRSGLLGQADINRLNDTEFLNENTIDYREAWGKHSLSVLGGVTFQTQSRETVIISANQIPSDGVGVNAIELAPNENTSLNSNYSEYSLFSLLGRVNYSYDGKYLATATIRRDGSSRLGAINRFALFPSVALAWNVAEESFFDEIKAINVLKVRTSYGLTGNQGVNPFSTLPTYAVLGTSTILGGAAVAGVTQGTLNNPDLRWETTAQLDFGIEIGMFQSRLTAELDFYYKKTEDLLLAAEVPTHTGYSTTIQNVGSLENKGLDFSLHGVIVEKENFAWSASLNLSTFKNKVLDLGSKTFITTVNMTGNQPAGQLIVGEPVGTFVGYLYESIDPATGDAIFTDISGPEGIPDGEISTEYDRTVIGNANPDFYGGFGTNIRFKNFDMNAFFPFTYGNQIYNTEAFWANEININGLASLRKNMWTPENTENASFASVGSTSMSNSSNFYLQDGSFLRLGTLQIGYTLPADLIKGVKNFRFYFTGTNLFLVKSKDYWGFDPDVSTFGDNPVNRGFDNYEYPQNRSLMLGLNITF